MGIMKIGGRATGFVWDYPKNGIAEYGKRLLDVPRYCGLF